MELKIEDIANRKKKVIFLLSYNPQVGPAEEVDGYLLVPLGCTFNQTGRQEDKTPVNVHTHDPNWQFVMACVALGIVAAIVYFLGFISSGSAAIIRLAALYMTVLPPVYFLLCHHDQKEKEFLLCAYGFEPERWRAFTDPKAVADPDRRCDEWSRMREYGRDIAAALSKGE